MNSFLSVKINDYYNCTDGVSNIFPAKVVQLKKPADKTNSKVRTFPVNNMD